MSFSSEFKPKKIKTEIKTENDKRAKKRKPDEVRNSHEQKEFSIFSDILLKAQNEGTPEEPGRLKSVFCSHTDNLRTSRTKMVSLPIFRTPSPKRQKTKKEKSLMEKRKQRKSQRRSGNGELFMQLRGYQKLLFR